MLDVYDIWFYPLQDWWRMVNEMSDFMSTRTRWETSFYALLYSLGSYLSREQRFSQPMY